MPYTWSDVNKSDFMALSGGNLTTDGADGGSVTATNEVSSGKWYWEITIGSPAERDLGIANKSHPVSNYNGQDANSWAYYGGDGNKYTNGSGAAYGAGFTTGDVISVALDMDNGKVFFAKNGTWQNSGDPVAGTGAAYTGLSGSILPCIGGGDNGVATANFGASSFAYTPPTGYSAFDSSSAPNEMFKVTQVAVEAVHGGSAKVRESQLAIESVHGAAAKIKDSQFAVEAVHGASAHIKCSQLVIELVYSRRQGVVISSIPRVLGATLDMVYPEPSRGPRERPEFGDARRIRDPLRGAGHRWIDNPGRRA